MHALPKLARVVGTPAVNGPALLFSGQDILMRRCNHIGQRMHRVRIIRLEGMGSAAELWKSAQYCLRARCYQRDGKAHPGFTAPGFTAHTIACIRTSCYMLSSLSGWCAATEGRHCKFLRRKFGLMGRHVGRTHASWCAGRSNCSRRASRAFWAMLMIVHHPAA